MTTLGRIAEIQDLFHSVGIDLDWAQAERVLEHDRAFISAGQPGFARELASLCGKSSADRIRGLRLVLDDDEKWHIAEVTP